MMVEFFCEVVHHPIWLHSKFRKGTNAEICIPIIVLELSHKTSGESFITVLLNE